MTPEQAIAFIIEDEGGYVDHPNDPGGETKYGISKRSYPDVDIKNLTVEQATEIYKRDFWDKLHVTLLPAHVQYLYADMAVNHGPRNAARILQRAAGVTDDGIVGPVTRKAAASAGILDICHQRMLFFSAIVANRTTQAVFLRGWTNRNFKVTARAFARFGYK